MCLFLGERIDKNAYKVCLEFGSNLCNTDFTTTFVTALWLPVYVWQRRLNNMLRKSIGRDIEDDNLISNCISKVYEN